MPVVLDEVSVPQKQCLHCKKEHSKRREFCSDICRWAAKNHKASEDRKSRISEKSCSFCQRLFTPVQNHPRYRYCSTACKNRHKGKLAILDGRAKVWRTKIDPVRRREQQRAYYHNPSAGYKERIMEANALRRSLQYKSKLWAMELTSFVFREAKHLCVSREKNTGIKWHVDHIIPVKGKEVCGLHVWNNFRVIPAAENLSKGNRLLEGGL